MGAVAALGRFSVARYRSGYGRLGNCGGILYWTVNSTLLKSALFLDLRFLGPCFLFLGNIRLSFLGTFTLSDS